MQAIQNTDNLMNIGALEGKAKKENPKTEEPIIFADIWSKLINMQEEDHEKVNIPFLGEVAEVTVDTEEKTHASQAIVGLPFMTMIEAQNELTPETISKGQVDIKIGGDAISHTDNGMPKSAGNHNLGNEAIIKNSGTLHNYAVNRGAATKDSELKSVSATKTPYLTGMEDGDEAKSVAGPAAAANETVDDVVDKTTGMKFASIPGKTESDADSPVRTFKSEDGYLKVDGMTKKIKASGPEADKSIMKSFKETDSSYKGIATKNHSDKKLPVEDNPEQPAADYSTGKNHKDDMTQTVGKSLADKAEITPDMSFINPESIKPDTAEKITDGEVVKQVIDKVNLQKLDQGEILRVRLKPDSLGSITIRLEKGDSGLEATISTTNSEVQKALAGGIGQLATALSEYGVNRDVINVVFEEDHFGENGANGFMFKDKSPDPRGYGGHAGRHIPVEQAEHGAQEPDGRNGTSMIDIYG